MLIGLHIENIAAIESLDLELEGGLNILSGETGAGKSIIIDSINMVTGARTSKSIIRNGSRFAFVQALFMVDGREILLSRKLYSDGRSVCKVNGELSTAAEIKEYAAELLTIHGQHENKILMKQSCHRELLDKFCKATEAAEDYRTSFEAVRELKERIDRINSERDEILKNLDMMRFRFAELSGAELKPNEDEELSEKRDILANAEKIAEAVSGSHARLYDTGGVHDLLSSAISELSGVSGYDKKLTSVLEMLESAECEIDEASRELGRFAAEIESNPAELEIVEQRLDLISGLKRKYGGSIGDIIKLRDELEEEIENAEFETAGTEKLEAQLETLTEDMNKKGARLSEIRRKGAEALSAAVSAELEFLDMKSVVFKVSAEPCEPSPHGFENITFLISTIPGEPPKPLIKIASGGELSRIMLALQTVLTDDVETLIFDEIDSGVSGRAASKIAKRLRKISDGRQVICITHLAQIAAAADFHFLIEKTVDEHTAKSSVKLLSENERLYEIARITGGEVVTETTLKSAAELLGRSKDENI